MTEAARRLILCLIIERAFDLIQLKPTKHKSPVSRDSELYHRKRRVESLIEEEAEPDVSLSTSASVDAELVVNPDENS